MDELFCAVHAYALMSKSDHRKTSREIIVMMLEPNMCDEHFSMFLPEFKYEIRGLTFFS